jgi:hypothetical protein
VVNEGERKKVAFEQPLNPSHNYLMYLFLQRLNLHAKRLKFTRSDKFLAHRQWLRRDQERPPVPLNPSFTNRIHPWRTTNRT